MSQGEIPGCLVAMLPVVGFPQELDVDQVGGFGNAVSVRLHQICVGRQLLLGKCNPTVTLVLLTL